MVFFLAPLFSALGAAGTATVAAGALAAGASVVASNNAKKTNTANVAAQNAANTQNIDFQREVNAQNRAYDEQDADRARSQFLEDSVWSLSRLRDNANLAGYNPLTALGATGGGSAFGGTSRGSVSGAASVAPVLSSINVAAGNGLRDVSDTLENTLGIAGAERRLQMDLQAVQADAIRSGVKAQKAAAVLPSRPLISGPKASDSVGATPAILGTAMRPMSRPTLMSEGQVTVFGPDGGTMTIPSRVAQRLKVKNWDSLIGEDYEALFGEQLGQGALVPKLPATWLNIEGGLFGPATTQEKANRIANPWSPFSYFPSFGGSPSVKTNHPRHKRFKK